MERIKGTITGETQTYTVDHFASASEFANAAITSPRNVAKADRCDSWIGGSSRAWAAMLISTGRGDDRYVGPAEQYMERIALSAPEALRSRWENAMAGATPDVGAFLAGRPDCMRRKVQVSSDRAPVRVFVDMTSSGGISASDLTMRGSAILAFVQLLSAERPVELYGCITLSAKGDYSSEGMSGCTFRIDTAPVQLSQVGHLLCSQAVTRGLGYSYLEDAHGAGGGWPFGLMPEPGTETAKKADEWVAEALGCGPNDLFVPPVFVGDPLIKDPVSWINKALAHYSGVEAETF